MLSYHLHPSKLTLQSIVGFGARTNSDYCTVVQLFVVYKKGATQINIDFAAEQSVLPPDRLNRHCAPITQPLDMIRIAVTSCVRLFVAVVALVATSAFAQAPSYSGNWTSRPLASTPAGGASGRGWVDLIYDPVVGRPVLFGGSGNTYMNDILQIDFPGSRWVEIEPYSANVTPAGPPCPRDEHAVEYDSLNRLYWSFGGSGFACNSRLSAVGAGSSGVNVVDTTLTQATANYYGGGSSRSSRRFPSMRT
jgi:hypothetical protein